MTALVICTYGGNPTACVVVASVISRMKRIRAKEDLAYSWALRASAILANRTAIGATD
ncbi:acetylornithine/succinyldiaminopimelate/putrescine aminotransferase [Bradyrhizobium huanghuaihaiense]